MLEVKQKARAVGVRAAWEGAIPGHDIGDRQARHSVVRQSLMTVPLASPFGTRKQDNVLHVLRSDGERFGIMKSW